MPGILLKNVEKRWASTYGVKDVSLEIEDGEFVVFLGPSGCGKTTTMRLVAGLETPSGGDIYIGDRRVNDVDPGKRNVAMVFQNYSLFPHMTVRNNLAYPLKAGKVPKAEHGKRIAEISQLVELDGLLERKPAELSGGQQQRVALGRALIRHPDVFLMDEPLSNMDAILRQNMRAELKNLHHRLRITTIFVTHDQVEAMTLATRIAVMKGGELHQFDTPENIFNEPATAFVAGFVGAPAMNLVDGRIAAGRFESEIVSFPIDTGFSGPVTLGLRPFHVEACNSAEAMGGGTVYSTEGTGEQTIVTVEKGRQQIRIKEQGSSGRQIREAISFRFDRQNCFFFDAASGNRTLL